jgi:hypothetical protein
MKLLQTLATLLACLALAACGEAPTVSTMSAVKPVMLDRQDIAALARTIQALGPEVDPDEAERAARVSIQYAKQLRQEYGVTDGPLIHNTKVNMGLRPRGLCYQWADDIEARLRQEDFKTLTLHRAIANSDNIRIEHSTVIVSRNGDDMFQGVVLDGWRNGGDLYWARTLEDDHYKWVPRQQVFAEKRRREGL